MCFYIANFEFRDDYYLDPEGPMAKLLVPLPFPTRETAEAALRSLVDEFTNTNPDEVSAEDIEYAQNITAVWGEHAIGLYNVHDPSLHTVYTNLFNDNEHNRKIAEALSSPEVAELARKRNPERPNLVESGRLPTSDEMLYTDKLLAMFLVEEFDRDPNNPRYADPISDDAYLDDTGTIRTATPEPSNDVSGFKVRGEG